MKLYSRALPYERGKQVLGLLAQYGPLSRKALHYMMDPHLEDRRLRDVAHRLFERGLITKKYDRIFAQNHNANIYYQIARSPAARRNVAAILGITPEALDVPGPTHQALLHWEECALWADRFKREFPEAKVYRETQFKAEPLIKNILLIDDRTFETLPDLMILLPGTNPKRPVAVAVEIEKNRKSSKRLYTKLKKYASGTMLDGVIYVCDSDAIFQAVQVVYRSKVIERSPRIGHYANHFVMFTPGIVARPWPDNLQTIRLEDRTLQQWMSILTTKDDSERRLAFAPPSANTG